MIEIPVSWPGFFNFDYMTGFPLDKTLFRDVNINDMNLSLNKDFIIETVLVRGGMNEVKKLFSMYSNEELVKAIKNSRGPDRITHNFCADYFNIPKTAMHAPSQYY